MISLINSSQNLSGLSSILRLRVFFFFFFFFFIFVYFFDEIHESKQIVPDWTLRFVANLFAYIKRMPSIYGLIRKSEKALINVMISLCQRNPLYFFLENSLAMCFAFAKDSGADKLNYCAVFVSSPGPKAHM